MGVGVFGFRWFASSGFVGFFCRFCFLVNLTIISYFVDAVGVCRGRVVLKVIGLVSGDVAGVVRVDIGSADCVFRFGSVRANGSSGARGGSNFYGAYNVCFVFFVC